jgi:hypothetical protein
MLAKSSKLICFHQLDRALVHFGIKSAIRFCYRDDIKKGVEPLFDRYALLAIIALATPLESSVISQPVSSVEISLQTSWLPIVMPVPVNKRPLEHPYCRHAPPVDITWGLTSCSFTPRVSRLLTKHRRYGEMEHVCVGDNACASDRTLR